MGVFISFTQAAISYRGASLEAVHERKHLRDDTSFHFPVGFVALGGDRVDLVDEDDRRGVLLSLFTKIMFLEGKSFSNISDEQNDEKKGV